MQPSPIAYFAFNRPAHTERTLLALAANPEAAATRLHAFVDGPRNAKESPLVERVLNTIKNAQGFSSVHLHAATSNLGLFASITHGVQAILDEHDSVIVVEDDIEVTPFFLAYMNHALVKYRDTPEVGSIHAYVPPIRGLPDYFFLRGADCWGWATWADRWMLFQHDPRQLLSALHDRGAMRSYMRSHGAQSLLQLMRRAQGRSQSWAIQWHASLFLANRFTLHPGTSFVANIGNDGSGTHAQRVAMHDTRTTTAYSRNLPECITEHAFAARALSSFLDRSATRGLPIPRQMLRSWTQVLASREAERIMRGNAQ